MIDFGSEVGVARYKARVNNIWNRLEISVIRQLKPVLSKQMKDAAKLYSQGVRDIYQPFTDNTPKLKAILRTHYKRTMDTAGFQALQIIEWMKSVDKSIKAGEGQLGQDFNTAILKYSNDHVGTNIKSIQESQIKDLQRVIESGVADGLSDAEIARKISKFSNTTVGYKALRIARTETHGAYNFATEAAVEGTGMNFTRKWSATIDAVTRVGKYNHLIADGQERPKGEPFVVSGQKLMYPGDRSLGASAGNVIHCRCVLTYGKLKDPIVKPVSTGPGVILPNLPEETPPPVAKPIGDTDWVPEPNPASFVSEEYREVTAEVGKMDYGYNAAEIHAIQFYSKGSDRIWNNYLRTGNNGQLWTAKGKELAAELRLRKEPFIKRQKEHIQDLRRFLNNAPRYKGVSYRGLNFNKGKSWDNFFRNLREGGEVRFKGFTSTDKSIMTAEDFMNMNGTKINKQRVLLEIHGENGRPLGVHSEFFPAENEILFQHNTRFRIKKVHVMQPEYQGEGQWFKVVIEEISEKPVAKSTAPMKAIGKMDNCLLPTAKAKYATKDKPDPCTDWVRREGKWSLMGREATEEELDRLKGMRIPPAWGNVVVSNNPRAKIQAIGMDKAGRWQYRYSEEHIAKAARKKFDRLKSFSKDMSGIRKAIDKGVQDNDPRAYLLSLENKTAIRVGSDTDFKAKKKAYGLTTLQHEHVAIKGNTIRLDFVAKEGIPASYEIEDKAIAKFLRERKEATKKGEKLFPDVPANKLNDYLKEIAGGKKYTVKDFRTYHGTRIAYEELQKYAGKELTEKAKAKIIKEVSTKASKFLANTPLMARKSYIDPTVWDIIGGL